MPLVFSVSEICPRKRKPRLVRSIKICLTISPRYMPLHIFSYLTWVRNRQIFSLQEKMHQHNNILISLFIHVIWTDNEMLKITIRGVHPSIFTFVCLRWASSRPPPGRTSSWCRPDSRCLQTPPTPCWHTYDPQFHPLSRCSSSPPCNRRYFLSLRGRTTTSHQCQRPWAVDQFDWTMLNK